MNSKTGGISEFDGLVRQLVLTSAISYDEAREEIWRQIESEELMIITQKKLTEKQLRENQISLHDNKSHYGKKFTNFRKRQRRTNHQDRS